MHLVERIVKEDSKYLQFREASSSVKCRMLLKAKGQRGYRQYGFLVLAQYLHCRLKERVRNLK